MDVKKLKNRLQTTLVVCLLLAAALQVSALISAAWRFLHYLSLVPVTAAVVLSIIVLLLPTAEDPV